MCLRIASPAISRVRQRRVAGSCRSRPRRTAPRESASRSPSPSLASGWSVSTIWSSRARNRSVCPLSRRSLDRIELPPTKPTERQNSRSNDPIRSRKKRNQQRPLSCKRNNLTILASALQKSGRLQIVHGQLASRSQSRGLSAWMKPLCIRDRPRRRADSRKSDPPDRHFPMVLQVPTRHDLSLPATRRLWRTSDRCSVHATPTIEKR